MAALQTRIFVPRSALYGGIYWAETLLGRVIKPFLEEHSAQVEWYWFSRYECTPEEDSDDCDISKVPAEFAAYNRQYRSLRFRIQVPDDYQHTFESDGSQKIAAEGCVISGPPPYDSGWLPYDMVGDLGKDRFVGEDRTQSRRRDRAKLVLSCLQSISALVLDGLTCPDDSGGFRPELNDKSDYGYGSSFEAIQHMFYNISDVHLFVAYPDLSSLSQELRDKVPQPLHPLRF